MKSILRCLFVATLLPCLGLASGSPRVSLHAFNPAPSRQSIENRQTFETLFMAIKEREQHAVEKLGISILLNASDRGIASERVRARAQELGGQAEGFQQAIAEVDAWIEAEAKDPKFVEKYLSYAGPGGKQDPDFLIYTSSRRSVARLYGEILFHIQPKTPRGVDLNSLNEALGYKESLSWGDYLNPRKALIRNLFDRDEYVVPSSIPNQEVQGFEVLARLPNPLPGKAVRLTGRRQRTYLRRGTPEHPWVEVFDRRNRRYGFLAPEGIEPVPDHLESSSKSLPETVLEAFESLTVNGQRLRFWTSQEVPSTRP